MKLKTFLKPIFTWWWLILLACVLAGITSYYISSRLPKVYTARTMLMVSSTISDPNPDIYQYSMIYQLTQTYAYIGYQDTVRNATMQALNISKLPDYDLTALSSGPFLEITVTDTDPAMAARIANEIANQLIKISPTSQEQTAEQQKQQFLQSQIADLQNKIKTTQEEIDKKQAALAEMTSAGDITQTQNDIAALENKLATYQSTYATLTNTTNRTAVNFITVFEPAAIPTQPIGPKVKLIVLIATLGGLLLAVLAAYLIQYLDDSIKDVSEIAELLNAPIIGTIANMPKGKGLAYIQENPESIAADSFHLLQVNLGFLGIDHPLHTILVTSPGQADGKSTVAVNLAHTMAAGNKKVLLVDADLRNPSLNSMLGVPNDNGLTSLFHEEVVLADVTRLVDDERIHFIPAGESPPNPFDLLASKRMERILEMLNTEYEMIIMDCSPLMVPDASVLAAKVDGVLLVVRPDHTSRRGIILARDQMNRVGAKILGVVVNGVSSRSSYYGKYYHSKRSKKSPLTEKQTSVES